MRDMVCDVITSCFRSCDVGKRSRCDKIVGPDLKPAKIETKMKKKHFTRIFIRKMLSEWNSQFTNVK